MFHYQQQRQQMMAQEKYVLFYRIEFFLSLFYFTIFFRASLDAKPVHSDDSDDEAPGGGDYTVYECPGLAPVCYIHHSIRRKC
jgi:hypothetical protein